MEGLNTLRAACYRRVSRYRARLANLPPGLAAEWRRSAPDEFPGIPTDAFFFVRAAEGLLKFFDAASAGRAPCSLPSLAADSVWHAWLRHDAASLESYCRRHCGRTIPHLEAGLLDRRALAAALVACRAVDGIAPQGPAVPGLFALDARLRMPQGHGYWARLGEVVYCRLDGRGRPRGTPQPHPDIALAALLAAGLISSQAYDEAMRPQQSGDSGASGTVTDGGPDCDGGAAADGGAGCGSSCGSGCGGGGD
jgi:hypothetical protein